MSRLRNFASLLSTAVERLARTFKRRRWNPDYPELPGQWKTRRRFRAEARERITRHSDGWSVRSHDPGHRFVAWELAVRYEAACVEALFHYGQICDLANEAEATERIRRIEAALADAQCLSRIEQQMRAMLADDSDAVAILASHPDAETPTEQPPRLRHLAVKHLDGILPTLEEVLTLHRQEASFHPKALTLIVDADRAIPGPGTHTAIWGGSNGYRYPFNQRYEAVLRPLRYVPVYLADGYANPLHNRSTVDNAGGYLEGCIKTAATHQGVPAGQLRRPLGQLINKHVTGLLDPPLCEDLRDFTDTAVNRAKHEYVNEHGTGSVFGYEDALFAYFLARSFGAAILNGAGVLADLDAAVATATQHGPYFHGAAISTGVVPPEGI